MLAELCEGVSEVPYDSIVRGHVRHRRYLLAAWVVRPVVVRAVEH